MKRNNNNNLVCYFYYCSIKELLGYNYNLLPKFLPQNNNNNNNNDNNNNNNDNNNVIEYKNNFLSMNMNTETTSAMGGKF